MSLLHSSQLSCPRTGQWFDYDAVARMTNPISHAPLANIALPVTIKGRDREVYELTELIEMYLSELRDNNTASFRLTDIVPVRYPGFKDYKQTVETLRAITNHQWQETTDPYDAPSVTEGEQQDTPDMSHSEQPQFTEFQRAKAEQLMKKHWDRSINHSLRTATSGIAHHFGEHQSFSTSNNDSRAWMLGGGGGLLLAAGLAYQVLNSPRRTTNTAT